MRSGLLIMILLPTLGCGGFLADLSPCEGREDCLTDDLFGKTCNLGCVDEVAAADRRIESCCACLAELSCTELSATRCVENLSLGGEVLDERGCSAEATLCEAQCDRVAGVETEADCATVQGLVLIESSLV